MIVPCDWSSDVCSSDLHAGQGGFTGSIGADQAKGLALLNLQVDVIDCGDLPAAGFKLFYKVFGDD
jgi:hypothetical protein